MGSGKFEISVATPHILCEEVGSRRQNLVGHVHQELELPTNAAREATGFAYGDFSVARYRALGRTSRIVASTYQPSIQGAAARICEVGLPLLLLVSRVLRASGTFSLLNPQLQISATRKTPLTWYSCGAILKVSLGCPLPQR